MKYIAIVLLLLNTHLALDARTQELAQVPEGSPAIKGEAPKQTENSTKNILKNEIPLPLPVRIIEQPPTTEDAKAHAKKAAEHEEHDLDAQKRMAKAAEAQLTATLVAVGVSVVGTFLLLWTLCETRKTANAAQQSIKALMDAESPYLRPHVNVCPTQQDTVAHYDFANDGKTPGIIIRFQDTLRSITALPDDVDSLFTEKWSDRTEVYFPVGPGQTGADEFTCRLHTDDEALVHDTGQYLYLLCRVEYIDLFGQVREQRFCWRFIQQGDKPVVTREGGTKFNYDRPKPTT